VEILASGTGETTVSLSVSPDTTRRRIPARLAAAEGRVRLAFRGQRSVGASAPRWRPASRRPRTGRDISHPDERRRATDRGPRRLLCSPIQACSAGGNGGRGQEERQQEGDAQEEHEGEERLGGGEGREGRWRRERHRAQGRQAQG